MTASPSPASAVAGPITVLDPQLAQLTAGRLDRLFRPHGAVADRWRPGQRIWVREPFHLPARYNSLAPTAAVLLGAKPLFSVDLKAEPDPQYHGPRRFARALPRVWHRQHLLISCIERRRIQAITQAEIEAQGFKTRAGFAAAWDRTTDFGVGAKYRSNAWREDPDILVIHFEWFPAPLPNQEGD